MENEDLNLDLDQDAGESERLKAKHRNEKLSEKLIFTAKERDEAAAKAKAEEDARLKVEKERDFFRDFSQVSSKYPNATSYQDKILEKVNAGYSAEDAAISILAKEGKLQPTSSLPPDNVAGGSAATAMPDSGEKDVSEMTQEERRNALIEAEKQGSNLLKF